MTDKEYETHRLSHNKQNSWWLNDPANIPLCRVCSDCEQFVVNTRYAHLFQGNYNDVVEEQIEPDE